MTYETPNATSFDYTDAPFGHQARYRRLYLLNADMKIGEWTDQEQLRHRDNLGLFDAVSSSLELTGHQSDTARDVFGGLPLMEIGNPASMVAFAVCALIVKEDGRDYYPSRAARNNDSLFVEFTASEGWREGVVTACIERVRCYL